MPALKNARQERFAQEIAKGATADAAYAEAGYRPHRANAARMSANEDVRRRVTELQERAAVRAEITVAGITERLLNIATTAEGKDEAAMLQVARASLMDAAKLNGLVVDKGENVDISTLTVHYVTSPASQPPAAPTAEDYETD